MEVCLPVGMRSCQNVHEDSGCVSKWQRVHDCGIEFAQLYARKLDPAMSTAAQVDAFSKISDLMAKARAGLIDFTSRNPEAKDIELPGYQHLLELRPKKGAATAFGRPARVVRLYYIEPLWLSDKLLALHLATKPDGPDLDKEQNSSIRVAGNRAAEWGRYSKQLTD